MNLPQQSLSAAFWDKRLELYHARRYGLWAFITGKFVWMFFYQSLILLLILAAAIPAAHVTLSQNIHIGAALSFYVVFVFTCFGIGLAGAGNFFVLEVKQGREPLTWLMDVLARIFSGVYYPITILPPILFPIAWFLPHTYALDGIRRVMLNGTGFDDPATLRAFAMLVVFCVLWMSGGIWFTRRAIYWAERGDGVGIAV